MSTETINSPVIADKPLDLKTINELLGAHFYIPKYQRGYRWSEQQVTALLDDVWAFANKKKKEDEKFYCLQPVVVKPKDWEEDEVTYRGYEVIDGQQRLTTIYIILSYLTKEFLKTEGLEEDYGRPIYSLRYETRPKSAAFLNDIIEASAKSNIDFYYIWTAYKTVKAWFGEAKNVKDRNDKNKFLGTLLGKKEEDSSVQIIWYEVPQNANAVALFTRLNVGKIPLTNAELIKALFLSSAAFGELADTREAERRKLEISHLWDEMEQRLAESALWAFATNEDAKSYATRIELLFNMKADKKPKEKDRLFTFLFFLNKYKEDPTSLWDLWVDIEQYYRTLCEWFKNKNLYHKVGFLVAIGTSLRYLITTSLDCEKKNFSTQLDKLIRKEIPKEFEALSYEPNKSNKEIENLLLLFNVESIRNNCNDSEFYPFNTFKSKDWSLEHIHAQRSDGLDGSSKDQWLTWISSHSKLIDELLSDIDKANEHEQLLLLQKEIRTISPEAVTYEAFKKLSQKIIDWFSVSEGDNPTEMHALSNLALLNRLHNSSLNNAVFEVKRRQIIEMDKAGEYIPLCTRRVFLKYYNTKVSAQHYYFWGKDDRDAYIDALKEELGPYLINRNS